MMSILIIRVSLFQICPPWPCPLLPVAEPPHLQRQRVGRPLLRVLRCHGLRKQHGGEGGYAG